MKPVLLDTGTIVALLDPTDSFHTRCSDAMGDVGAPLVTCETVVAESCYLLRRVEGAPEAILHSVATREFLIPLGLVDAALPVRRIMAKYRDRNIDLADAFLIHLADEQLLASRRSRRIRDAAAVARDHEHALGLGDRL